MKADKQDSKNQDRERSRAAFDKMLTALEQKYALKPTGNDRWSCVVEGTPVTITYDSLSGDSLFECSTGVLISDRASAVRVFAYLRYLQCFSHDMYDYFAIDGEETESWEAGSEVRLSYRCNLSNWEDEDLCRPCESVAWKAQTLPKRLSNIASGEVGLRDAVKEVDPIYGLQNFAASFKSQPNT